MSLLNKENGLALLAGLVCVFGFAPFGFFPLPVLALAVLFVLLQRAASPRAAAWLGWWFGLGLFSAGIGWIYVALHDYGAMPFVLALPATLLFAAFLALFPALAAWLPARFVPPHWSRTVLALPAAWVLLEWVRGLIFTGFPWLTLGYAHSGSPLAGYAPLLGVYGVSLMAALSAGLLAYTSINLLHEPIAVLRGTRGRAYPDDMSWPLRSVRLALGPFATVSRDVWFAILILGALWGGGALLRNVAWTEPQGAPVSVALVQGNIPQDIKFNLDALIDTLKTYRSFALQSEARLTVLPETALPILRDEVPTSLIEQLREHARANGGDMLIGVFERDDGSYYNSVFTLGSAPEQHYRKQHLVPFGEFIPLRPVLGWFINSVLDIPMGDQARGAAVQPPLAVAGQRVAVNICYEDVFGEEIIRALPQATLLVNVTNDAWYGHSHAAAQHNQISQMRALETGRMMLRATNTGVTAIIDRDGRILQQLPQHQAGMLTGEAQGYSGSTPYVRWGNAAVLLLIALLLIAARLMSRKPSSRPRAGVPKAGNPLPDKSGVD